MGNVMEEVYGLKIIMYILEILEMMNFMEQDYLLMNKVIIILAIGKIVYVMVQEYYQLIKNQYIKENLKIVKKKDMEKKHMKMEIYIKALFIMEKKMENDKF